MLLSGFVPAFIEVGIQLPFKLIVRIEQLEELQRQFVIYFPAIGRSVCPDIEVLRSVLSDYINAVRLLRSELRAKAQLSSHTGESGSVFSARISFSTALR